MYFHVLRSAAVLLAVSGVTFTAALSPGSIFERTLAAAPSAISLKDADSVPLNSPGIIERSMCLTISLLKSAAYECGGLRIVHQLPSVRVLGKAQIPTLVWNSERANPFPQIALDVSLPSGTSIPDKIRYVVKVAGTPRDSVEISNSQFTGIGSNRKRITVSWDAWSVATGVYPVTVDAVSFYGSTLYTTSVNTAVIVINDRSSSFGQGWWLQVSNASSRRPRTRPTVYGLAVMEVRVGNYASQAGLPARQVAVCYFNAARRNLLGSGARERSEECVWTIS